MPIDPNVLGGLTRPAPYDPLAMAQRREQLANLTSLMQDRQQQALERQRTNQDQQKIAGILQGSSSADEVVKNLEAGGYYDQAAKLGKSFADQRKAAQEAADGDLKQDQALVKMGAQALNGITDESSYQLGRKMFASIAANDPHGQAILSMLPEQYDPVETPKVIKRLVATASTVQEQNTQAREAVKDVFGSEPVRGLATLYSQADNQDDWNGITALAQSRGLPAEVTAQFGGQFSPEAKAKAQQLSMTGGERATDTRLRESQAATEKDRSADNARADAELTLRKQEFGLRKQTETRLQTQAQAAAPIEIKPGTKEYREAQDLADGTLTMADFFRIYGRGEKGAGLRSSLYDTARQLNPNFSPADFEIGYKFASDPSVRKQIASVKNVESGVDDLLKFSDAAKRSGTPLFNQAIVPGGVKFGSKTYSNFATAVTAFADELSGSLGYGSATDMAREMGIKMTDLTQSPDVFRSNIEDVVLPFVARKKASLLGQMGPYGREAPSTGKPAAPATAPTKLEFGPDGKTLRVVKGGG